MKTLKELRKSIKLRFYVLGIQITENLAKLRRCIWNRGILLKWNKLYIRKDEFHKSLSLDTEAMIGMTEKKRDEYMLDIMKRRKIAHEADLARSWLKQS